MKVLFPRGFPNGKDLAKDTGFFCLLARFFLFILKAIPRGTQYTRVQLLVYPSRYTLVQTSMEQQRYALEYALHCHTQLLKKSTTYACGLLHQKVMNKQISLESIIVFFKFVPIRINWWQFSGGAGRSIVHSTMQFILVILIYYVQKEILVSSIAVTNYPSSSLGK